MCYSLVLSSISMYWGLFYTPYSYKNQFKPITTSMYSILYWSLYLPLQWDLYFHTLSCCCLLCFHFNLKETFSSIFCKTCLELTNSGFVCLRKSLSLLQLWRTSFSLDYTYGLMFYKNLKEHLYSLSIKILL